METIVSCGIRWGNPVGGGMESVQSSSSNILGTNPRPCSGLDTRNMNLFSFLLSTQWLLKPFIYVLKLLSESPPTPAYPIITHWGTVASSTKKMELRLPKPREGGMSCPHPSPRQGPPSTPQGLGSVVLTILPPSSCTVNSASV